MAVVTSAVLALEVVLKEALVVGRCSQLAQVPVLGAWTSHNAAPGNGPSWAAPFVDDTSVIGKGR